MDHITLNKQVSRYVNIFFIYNFLNFDFKGAMQRDFDFSGPHNSNFWRQATCRKKKVRILHKNDFERKLFYMVNEKIHNKVFL